MTWERQSREDKRDSSHLRLNLLMLNLRDFSYASSMMKLIPLFILAVSFKAFALETDNYIVWKKELKDSSYHINRFFAEGIEEALLKIPDHSEKSCDQMTRIIANDFASFLVHDNPVENWLFEVLTDEEIFPDNLKYVDKSIYREPYRFYIPWFGLAPNIQANGYYFGTDKLSHFASTGMTYYKIFQKALKLKKSREEAMKMAIDYGVLDEKSIHGYLASGVFSYADLESNYQGLQFYLRFCEGHNSYLKKTSQGEWKLRTRPDIKDYVSGYWDESFYTSYRLSGDWTKVTTALKDYCPLMNSFPVKKRMQSYQSRSLMSFSILYLNEKRLSGKIPDPTKSQSLTDLCSL